MRTVLCFTKFSTVTCHKYFLICLLQQFSAALYACFDYSSWDRHQCAWIPVGELIYFLQLAMDSQVNTEQFIKQNFLFNQYLITLLQITEPDI